ncbi:MAG: acyl-[acyl-carrier-protein] thioesterase [Lachnospiraceae bacterium]|nr:acyl-[acyl-carrier-protein] thioesterase [Lachnospiraceae bacterium]
MFTFDSVVRYSETGTDGKLTLPSIVNYFQDCSELHSNSLGVSVTTSETDAWILNSWQIQIKKYPSIDEHIKVGTAPHKFKGIQGERNFLILDKDNNVLVNANSIWSFFDFEANTPKRVTDEQVETYKPEPPYDMDYAPRRINIKNIEESAYQEANSLTVTKSMTDYHNHMNNAQYVLVAYDYLPDDYKFNQLRVEYLKPTMRGDVISVKTYLDNDRFIVLIANANETRAILEFTTI